MLRVKVRAVPHTVIVIVSIFRHVSLHSFRFGEVKLWVQREVLHLSSSNQTLTAQRRVAVGTNLELVFVYGTLETNAEDNAT